MSQHLQRAQLLMNQQRYELAEEQLRLALADEENRGFTHGLLALCLLERERFDDAQEHAQQAIHEAPDESFSFYVLGRVLLERNRLAESEPVVRDAIRLNPYDADNFALLAEIARRGYRWSECLAATEEGLAQDPDNEWCINLRAMALVKLGRRDEAGQSIDAALQHNPEDGFTHANQGWTLLHDGQPQKAMEHFREALRLEPNLEWARLGIIEAMKAKFFLYRWMLGFFLWMTKFPPKVQIALVLGVMFGNRWLIQGMAAIPALAPYTGIIAWGYLFFVLMSWTASTLFNLVLCLSRFGRLVLNRTEKLGAGLAASCIVCGLAVGGLDALLSDFGVGWLIGGLFLGLLLPVTFTFQVEGRKQLISAVYSTGLFLLMCFTVWKLVQVDLLYEQLMEAARAADRSQKAPAEALVDLQPLKALELDFKLGAKDLMRWWDYCFNGIVWSTWLGLGLSVVPEPKR